MKVLYRSHRSSLKEAMKDVREFNSIKEMCEYLIKDSRKAFTISDIYISYYCYDKRIDWETYIVKVGKYDAENYIKKYNSPQGIGFCTIIE